MRYVFKTSTWNLHFLEEWIPGQMGGTSGPGT